MSTSAAHHQEASRPAGAVAPPEEAPLASRVFVCAATVAIVLLYALRGGSYDNVVHEEEALALWWLIGLGWAFGLLPRARPPRAAAVPVVALGLLALWTGLSLIWTQSDERTFVELARALHYLAVPVLVWSCIGRGTWRAAAYGLAIAAVAVCALAVASRLSPSSFPTNYILTVFKVDRLSYPLNYWNAVAAWAVMSTVMAATISAHAKQLAVRAAFLALTPMCGLVAYLTYSRQAVGGIAIGLLLILALSRNRWMVAVHLLAAAGGAAIAVATARVQPEIVNGTGGGGGVKVVLALLMAAAICVAAVVATWRARGERWRLRPPAGRVGAAVAAVAVLLIVAVPAHNALSSRWDEFRSQSAGPPATANDPASRLSSLSGTRYEQWKSAYRAFEAHPGDGTGAGTFEFWWSEHGGGEFVRDVHSVYLEQLAELGLPGFLLLLALLLSLAVVGVRARMSAVDPVAAGLVGALLAGFGVYLVHAGVDWMWEVPAVTVLALAAAATAVASRSGPAPSGRLRGARAAVSVFALLAALVQLPPLVSTSELRDSQAALRAGDPTKAFDRANKAIEAEPWAASPYVQRGLLHEATGDLPAALRDVRHAAQREPTNWRHPLLLARIEAESGHASQALTQYRRARVLRPASPFVSPP